MSHLDENSKKHPKIKSGIVDVLAETVLIAAGGSIGLSGFPPISEIREFRENFEDFFQSGKSGKNRGFSAKIREKNSNQGTFFPKHFQTFCTYKSEENVF